MEARMTVKRMLLAAALAVAGSTLLPSVAAAQSVVTGIVRDTSGAVMPGVTVEAASPALIEGVRTAVTDSNGAYRIVDLRPGIYTLKYELTGFNTQVRDGFELAGELHGHGQYRPDGRHPAGKRHGVGCFAGGRRAEQRQAAGADARRAERGAHRGHDSGPRANWWSASR